MIFNFQPIGPRKYVQKVENCTKRTSTKRIFLIQNRTSFSIFPIFKKYTLFRWSNRITIKHFFSQSIIFKEISTLLKNRCYLRDFVFFFRFFTTWYGKSTKNRQRRKWNKKRNHCAYYYKAAKCLYYVFCFQFLMKRKTKFFQEEE